MTRGDEYALLTCNSICSLSSREHKPMISQNVPISSIDGTGQDVVRPGLAGQRERLRHACERQKQSDAHSAGVASSGHEERKS